MELVDRSVDFPEGRSFSVKSRCRSFGLAGQAFKSLDELNFVLKNVEPHPEDLGGSTLVDGNEIYLYGHGGNGGEFYLGFKIGEEMYLYSADIVFE